MKKVFLKMSLAVLAIVILSQLMFPILESGEVQAASSRTITGRTIAEIERQVGADEKYTIVTTYKKYKCIYTGTITLSNVPRCLLNNFTAGNSYVTNLTDSRSVYARVKTLNKTFSKNQSHYVNQYATHTSEARYNLQVYVQADYYTPEVPDKSYPSSIRTWGNYGGYSFDKTLGLLGVTELETTKYVAVVEKKSVPNTGGNYIDGVSEAGRKQFVRDLYQRVLRRTASESEVNHHYNVNCGQIASNIIQSQEAIRKNNLNGISNEEYVKCLYRFIFNRAHDSGGLTVNTNFLNSGHTKGELIRIFASSTEFHNRYK